MAFETRSLTLNEDSGRVSLDLFGYGKLTLYGRLVHRLAQDMGIVGQSGHLVLVDANFTETPTKKELDEVYDSLDSTRSFGLRVGVPIVATCFISELVDQFDNVRYALHPLDTPVGSDELGAMPPFVGEWLTGNRQVPTMKEAFAEICATELLRGLRIAELTSSGEFDAEPAGLFERFKQKISGVDLRYSRVRRFVKAEMQNEASRLATQSRNAVDFTVVSGISAENGTGHGARRIS